MYTSSSSTKNFRNYSNEIRINMLGPFFNQTSCEITFDNNPERRYYAGEKISGYIRLTLHKEHTLRGIFVKIFGKAYCHWSDGGGEAHRNHTGEEIVINEKQYVAGSNRGQSTYAPAEYTYPFDWDLPVDLPISFDAKYGYIRYKIVAGLDRPLRLDKCYKELFTVMKRVDLNKIPDLNNPLELEKVSKFASWCLLCCSLSSPFIMKVSLDAGGYVPSETIQIDLRLVNNSNLPIKTISCKFVQTITYHPFKNSKVHEKVDTVTLVEQISNGCPANSIGEQHINILIPAGLLTTETSSYVCMLEYALVITGTVSGCHINPVLNIPIVIGTVPPIKRSVEHLEAFPSIDAAHTFNSYTPNVYSSTYGDTEQSEEQRY